MEQFADYGAATRMGMEDVALAIGLPGKIGGHGSEVAAMAGAGELERVRAYCEDDCLNLFAHYVRHALLTSAATRRGTTRARTAW